MDPNAISDRRRSDVLLFIVIQYLTSEISEIRCSAWLVIGPSETSQNSAPDLLHEYIV